MPPPNRAVLPSKTAFHANAKKPLCCDRKKTVFRQRRTGCYGEANLYFSGASTDASAMIGERCHSFGTFRRHPLTATSLYSDTISICAAHQLVNKITAL